jgi:hypothetical protein
MTSMNSRALNRALLARQLLLERQPLGIEAAIEHLVGLQAQNPRDPYLGLLARVEDFEPAELSRMLASRGVARAALMRATLHLATAGDCVALRSAMAPVLARTFGSTAWAKASARADLDAVLAVAAEILQARPRTRAELGPLLSARFPERDGASLSYAVTYLMPLVQVPPRGLWDRSGPATWAPMLSWLGQPLPEPGTPDALVLRYLAAFGPAAPRDIRVWSGLAGLGEVVERLRPGLVTFRDEQGVELFDLPDAPRPEEDLPAPVRFLPEYDNLLLSHADRSRVIPEGRQPTGWAGNLLLDGFYLGSWKPELSRRQARLVVKPQARLSATEQAAIEAEGMALLAKLAPEVEDREVQLDTLSR